MLLLFTGLCGQSPWQGTEIAMQSVFRIHQYHNTFAINNRSNTNITANDYRYCKNMSSSMSTNHHDSPDETAQTPGSSPANAIVVTTEIEVSTELNELNISSPTSPPPEDRMPNLTSAASPPPQASMSDVDDSVVEIDEPPALAIRPTSLGYTPPKSSLPPWTYTSPRLMNHAVRQPSAMAHRAYKPPPQTPNNRSATPAPLHKELFTEHGLHGQTTYTSMPLEQIEFDPDDYFDKQMLEITDERPMGGNYLTSAKHTQDVKNLADEYKDAFDEQIGWEHEFLDHLKKNSLDRLPITWHMRFARENENISPQYRDT